MEIAPEKSHDREIDFDIDRRIRAINRELTASQRRQGEKMILASVKKVAPATYEIKLITP